MANKKLYTDFPEVTTSGLTDSVPTLQTTMKTTTLQKVLNLFRANADATTSAKGFVELATNAETQAGTDTDRAVTPAGLESKTATVTRKGIAELATQTEVNDGADTERIVTPATLKLNIFNPSNSATASEEVTIDALSGVATFTKVIPHNDKALFTINNSLVAGSSDALVSLKYNGSGYPVILHYEISGDGVMVVHIGNLNIDGGNASTDADLIVSFKLLS